ncbi:MAG: glycosyl transferase family 2, partial [Spirosomaceae bacterium]|nr:glycosyl transferase family 2 [Spirosomataceae bacterium]
LISSFVTFFDKSRLSDSVQIIEFASLVGSGACAMAIQKPNMCNGANISYRKDVFFEVGGFSGNENLASGDDEFLMHKIAAKYPDKVQFLKSQKSIVETYAHHSFKSFYLQRKRWASKWKHYQNKSVSALAVFVFLANFSVILVSGWYFFGDLSLRLFLVFLAIKFSAEFIFLSLILKFLHKKSLIPIIPIVQVIYPFYVSFFGLIAQGDGYEWKGRKLK